MTPRISIFALLAAAGLAHAQDCIWTQLTPAGTSPSPRAGAALAYDSARARVVLYGGSTGSGETWEWDGTTWTLMATTGPGPRLGSHAIAYHAARARTVLFGGASGPPFPTWEWDGQQWTLLPEPLPGNQTNALGHCLIYDGAHQRLFALGGTQGATQFREFTPGAPSLWTPLSISGPSTSYAVAAYDSDRGKILYLGGMTNTVSTELWEFDASTPSCAWTLLGLAPIRRYLASAAYDPIRHRFIVHSGLGPTSGPGAPENFVSGDVWEYDPATTTWARRADDGPGHRSEAAMVYDNARNAVLLFGGRGLTFNTTFNDLWQYRGQNSRSVLLQSFPLQQHPTVGQSLSMTALVQGAKTLQWQRSGVNLVNGGTVSGALSPALTISPVATSDSGNYTLVMSCSCGTANPTVPVQVHTGVCYCNCDQSTTYPHLNANDFLCFINKYNIGDTYANCDGSTGTPMLTPNDFHCFINVYNNGCP